MITLRLWAVFAVILSSAVALRAQLVDSSAVTLRDQSVDDYGVHVSGALNLHSASFTQLGGVRSCCPEFTGAAGLGWSAGAFYTYALNAKWRLQGRLSYANRSASLTDTERSFVADLRDSARVVEALFTHEVAATFTDIGIEPLLLFRPIGRLDLMVGGRVAIPITTRFRQTETLTEPADYGSYLGAGRVYIDTTADIPNVVSPQLSLTMGLRYVVPMGARGATFFAPEVQYTIPLTQISAGTTWSIAHLRFGVSIGLTGLPDRPVVIEPTPTLPVQPPALPLPSAEIVARGITTDGRELDIVSLRVEEIAATEIVPVLPHVYFDSASTRWITEQSAARAPFEQSPDKMDLETAIHSVPWLIAQRLAQQPTVRANLIGTTSDNGSDKGLALARERAQSVKDMFIRRGVDASQLTITARRFPLKPTIASDTTQTSLAAAENRRVEIESSDPSLLAPFSFPYVEQTIDPPTMRAYIQVRNIDSVGRWTVKALQGSTLLASFQGENALPPYVEWNFADSGIPATEAPIELTLQVVGSARLAVSDTVDVSQLTIKRKRTERIAGREIERINLLLFEFNDTRVGAENTRLLEQVRNRITPATEVTVYGLTDELGGAEYNQDLSNRRAAEVAAILNVPQTRIVGKGEVEPKYSSKTPVARGYSRTVVIELVTSVP